MPHGFPVRPGPPTRPAHLQALLQAAPDPTVARWPPDWVRRRRRRRRRRIESATHEDAVRRRVGADDDQGLVLRERAPVRARGGG